MPDVDAKRVEDVGRVRAAAERDEGPRERHAAPAPRQELLLPGRHLPPLARALPGPRGRRAPSARRGREPALRELRRELLPRAGRRRRPQAHRRGLGEEVDGRRLHPRVRGQDGPHPRRAAAAHHAGHVEQHGGAGAGAVFLRRVDRARGGRRVGRGAKWGRSRHAARVDLEKVEAALGVGGWCRARAAAVNRAETLERESPTARSRRPDA